VLDEVGTFERPSFVTTAPAAPARLYVVEQTGRVRIVENGSRDPACSWGSGTWSRAPRSARRAPLDRVRPRLPRERLFYVFYVQNDGDIRIDELERSATDPCERS
jgi:hypothetical protein